MNNNQNKPFKVQKLDDPSVLYPHLTDYVPKEKYIPQKPNIKVNRTQSLIRKVPHIVDQYQRQECIERFQDLKNRIQVKIPFKCPKNHKIQTKKPFLQDTNVFAQKTLINNLNQLQINEKSILKQQQYQQLKNKVTQIFNRKPKHKKQTDLKFGFDKAIFHDIPNLQKLLNIKESHQRKSPSKTTEKSKRLSKSQKKLENTQLSQSLLNINNPNCEQNQQNIATSTQNQSQIQPALDVSPSNQGLQIKLFDSNINNSNSSLKEIPSSYTQKVEQQKTNTPKAATPKDNTLQSNILQANSPLKTDTPRASAPKANTPKANTPKANTPKANTPKIDAPKANTPKANTPTVKTSKANTPKANTPNADIHKENNLKANTLKANTPKENTPKNNKQQIIRQNSQFSEERKEGSQQYEAREETKSQSIRKGSHEKKQQFDNCEVVVTVVRNGGRILKTEQTQRPNSAKSKTPTQQVFPLKKTKSQVKTTRSNETIDISQFRKQNNVNQPKIEKKQRKKNNDRPKSAIINQLGGQYISNRPKSVQKANQINIIEISELKQEIIHKNQKKQQEQGKVQISLVDSQAIPNSNSNRKESPQKILESFLNSKLQDSQRQMGESQLQEQLSLTVSQVSEQPMKQSRFIKKQN